MLNVLTVLGWMVVPGLPQRVGTLWMGLLNVTQRFEYDGGQRDSGTARQRDSETAGRRDSETARQRDSETAGQRDSGTVG